MFGFGRKKSARAGIRAALLAGATVAAVGLGAVGSASASPLCTGSNIIGKGSSLQNIAQVNVWKVGFEGGICPGGPTVTYTSGGSGAGLSAWNFDNVSHTINHEFQYIASDDAPTGAQISNALSATEAGAGVLTIPVAQTSISIAANPPAGCEVKKITNEDLQNVFRGAILKWSQLSQFLGEGKNPACNKAITRVVRLDSSGTTFQFKNYLAKLNTKEVQCAGGKTWQELEPTGTPNLTWPEDEGCEVTLSPLTHPGATGGGAVAEKVFTTPNSIGYAALPDAKAKLGKCEAAEITCINPEILNLQDNGKKKLSAGATFANPAVEEEPEANCLSTVYTVPTNARPPASKTHTGLNVDWSAVFGAKIDTTTSGSGYPLCTLTYDLAFNHYEKAGFSLNNEKTVNDYLNEYIVQPAGQTAISSNYYAPLPEGATATTNVLAAAKFTASKISP